MSSFSRARAVIVFAIFIVTFPATASLRNSCAQFTARAHARMTSTEKHGFAVSRFLALPSEIHELVFEHVGSKGATSLLVAMWKSIDNSQRCEWRLLIDDCERARYGGIGLTRREAEITLRSAPHSFDDDMMRDIDARKSLCFDCMNPSLIANNVADTQLMSAAYVGDEEKAKCLIALDANVNAQGVMDNVALHYAAQEQRVGIIKLLVRAGADVNILDEDRGTPLHDAIIAGHVDVAAMLLDAGANMEIFRCIYPPGTPLQIANELIRPERIKIMKLLLQRGAVNEPEFPYDEYDGAGEYEYYLEDSDDDDPDGDHSGA
jgi:hypothetical protein